MRALMYNLGVQKWPVAHPRRRCVSLHSSLQPPERKVSFLNCAIKMAGVLTDICLGLPSAASTSTLQFYPPLHTHTRKLNILSSQEKRPRGSLRTS